MTTVNYAWTLPTVGASTNTWGTLLNTILTDIDLKMVTATHIVAERSASRALTNLTGITLASGDAQMANAAYVRGKDSGGTTTRMLGINAGNEAYVGSIDSGAVTTLNVNLAGTNRAVFSSTGLAVTGDVSIPNDNVLQWGVGSTYIQGSAASNLIRFVTSSAEVARIDASGSLLVGTTTGSQHTIQKTLTPNAGNVVLDVLGGTNYAFRAYAIGSFLANSANSALRIGTDGGTGRSINAGGTINASGADYAEYERSNGLTIAKGEIVGFKLDGTLTRTFSEAAARFGVKSTNPGLVGGDTWGSEEIVGKRPEQPVRKADVTETTGEGNEAVTTVIEAGDTDEEWQAKKDAYAAELAVWEAKLEVERQKVDRIAYSGKVPCNVMGATPGGYIIAAEAEDGSIKGEFVASPTFEQYKLAVGRVNRILPDGRCEIAVIIH